MSHRGSLPVEGLDFLFAEDAFINDHFFRLHVRTCGLLLRQHVQGWFRRLIGGRMLMNPATAFIQDCFQGDPARACTKAYKGALLSPMHNVSPGPIPYEYVHGKVVDKYRLENGNLGLIVEMRTAGAIMSSSEMGIKGVQRKPLRPAERALPGKQNTSTIWLRKVKNRPHLSYSKAVQRGVLCSLVSRQSQASALPEPVKLIDLPYRHGARGGY